MKSKLRKGIVKAGMLVLCSALLLTSDVAGVMPEVSASALPGGYYTNPIMLAGDIDTPTGKPGERVKVQLHLVNRGQEDAKDVTVTPKVSSDSSVFPFKIDKASYTMRLDGGKSPSYDDSVLEGEEDDKVTFYFTVRDDAVTGYYKIDFEISYVIEGETSNEYYTTDVSSYVYIDGKDADAGTEKENIQISLQNSPMLPVATYGQPYSFELILTNYGETDAESVTITPEISADGNKFPFEVELTSYEWRFNNSLKGTKNEPSESSRNQSVTFNWKVRNDVGTGYYPVVFHITAKTPKGESYTVDQTVFFNISGNPKTDKKSEEETTKQQNKSEPRLIITGYEIDKEEIKAGDEFRLTVYIMNTSDRTAVSNIKLTLSSSEDKNDNCFVPKSGSSTIFVKRIGIGETYNLEVDMTAKPTLEAKSYPLTIEAEYEDYEVTPYTSRESISIPVTQELRISVGNVEVMPASIDVGNQSNIMFPINNLGKSKVYNVNVTFEGDSITGGESFEGNLESGATANVDTMVTGIAATMDEGYIKAIISYENEKGEVFTQEKEIQLWVTEAYVPDIGMDDMYWDNMEAIEPEVQSGLPQWVLFAAVGGVAGVGLLVGIIIIVRHRKRRKQEEDIEEDEDI